jgi:cardiolipin synthase
MVLAQSCATLRNRPEEAKEDGALCDWFGVGCLADPPLFQGPACATDLDCLGQSFCLEGHCFRGVGSQDFAGILDELTGRREFPGNTVQLVEHNSEALALWQELIDGAEQSIHVIVLYFDDDPVSEEVIAQLAEAARRGVEVRVLYDSFSQPAETSRLLDVLVPAGAQALGFNPVLGWGSLRRGLDLTANDRMHEKLLVVDGTTALLGGRNVGEGYMRDGRWHDTDVLLRGPAVAAVQRVFLEDWDQFLTWERRAGCPQAGAYCPAVDEPPLSNDTTYYPEVAAAGDALVRIVFSNPRAQWPAQGWDTYLALVRAARYRLRITNAYFVPPRRLRRHLLAAVERGVEVEVLTNSKESNDYETMWYASANCYEELMRGGVRIYEYQGEQTMHAKNLIVDDELALVGSFNLDPRSVTTNSELLALFRHAEAVDELDELFDDNLERSQLADYDFTPAERLLIATHRLVEPLL